MAEIMFIDGCTHYATADLTRKYYNSSSVEQRAPGYGGNRRADAGFLDLGFNGFISTHILTVAANLNWGMAVNPVEAGNSKWSVNFLMDNSAQCTLHYDGSQLHLRRGDYTGTVLGSSAAGIMPAGAWSYIEVYVRVHNSAGSTEVRLNGSEVAGLTLTNQDTQAHATEATVENIRVRNISSGAEVDVCDMVVNYGGHETKGFLGDVVIDTIMPTADSNPLDWTPNQGANIDCIDDDGAIDGDATYNYTEDNGDADLFTTADLTPRPSSAILAVVPNLCARKDDATTRRVRAYLRTNPSMYYSEDVLNLTELDSDYRVLQAFLEVNPETSNPWTESEVNGSSFGYNQVS